MLAKRKTAMLKAIDEEREETKRLKLQREERKVQRDHQMVIPDATSIEFERQLRKLATRGGICLHSVDISTQFKE